MNYEEILSLPINKASFCVLDVETTGLSPQHNNIIELGIVRVKNLKIVEKYHSLINPRRDIPAFITGFTGISNDDVYNAPFFEDIADEVIEFIGSDVVAGHNLPFDNSFVKRELRYSGREELKNPNLCTLRVAKRIFPLLKSKSLGSVSSFLKIKNRGIRSTCAGITKLAIIAVKVNSLPLNL